MIRIAHITTVDMSLRYLLLGQLRALRDAGYDVTGISTAGIDVEEIQRHGIRHLAVPMTRRLSPVTDLHSLWRLYGLLRRERFAIVHTHNPKPGLLGQLAARGAGIPIVVNTIHGFYFHENMRSLERKFYIHLERLAATCSNRILFQSREDMETAVREGIAPPEKITYLGNGIDLGRFSGARPNDEKVRRLRSELRLDSAEYVVGFVGRLVREKGLQELIEAAAYVRRKVPGVRVLVVGPEDHEKNDAVSPQSAGAFGVEDICSFVGLRNDLPDLYGLMDVLVLPSYREGLPRVPMEASAMGIPCIVTDVRGCREVVSDGETGYVVPSRDAMALATAIVHVLTDDGLREKLGRQARERARRDFDERSVIRRLTSTYEELLSSANL